ncbi:Lrp/AsnC family transcriptional regulator [Haloprofundus salinisoli]|uniref:Lrp/AsnC family transcriptional regulator n=1 Tax=Haloprofundus salinisoli TaxID=2876193 RepID=UPI001CCA3401|nr:Lrp/AsnC family transcriptional regulator [Haloprofundus salinisoli]
MTEDELDTIDHEILHALQEDARNNTNAAISDRVGVSASTVGKRIKRLEEGEVIKGYRTEIDYELAGQPLRVLFICTAPIANRSALIEKILEINGVVNVLEMMTGEGNIHVQVVGASNQDITRIAETIDSYDLVVNDEILIRSEQSRPSTLFD